MRQVNPVFTVAHYASEVTYCIEVREREEGGREHGGKERAGREGGERGGRERESPTLCSLQGFLEKNRDLMRQDVLDVLATSRMDLVRGLIGLPPYAVKRWHLAINTVLAVTCFGSTLRHKQRQNESVSFTIPVSHSLITCCY